MEKTMPDLFVVMNDEELVEAIEYARSQGARHANSLIALNYDLVINRELIEERSEKSGKWFPDFVTYIKLPTANFDSIGILLSPTVWNTYDDSLVYKTLLDNKITFDILYDPIFIAPRKLMDKIESDKVKSQRCPINSPWTARDIEVVETALASIRGIKKATLLRNTNFEINIYVNDFNNTVDEFLIASEVSKKRYVEEFYYPNVLHLETDDGVFNVFMGSDIDLKKVIEMLDERNIDTVLKDYENTDKELLLYDSREHELKLS